MQPVPFNSDSDLPPIPFDSDVCTLAQQLKSSGLPWVPHVGRFVWDPEHLIKPAAPFPNNIYYRQPAAIRGNLRLADGDSRETRLAADLASSRPPLPSAWPCPHAIQKASNPAEELQSLYRLLRDALIKP